MLAAGIKASLEYVVEEEYSDEEDSEYDYSSDDDDDTDDDSIGGKKAGGETNAGKIKKAIIEVRRDAARIGGVFRYFNWIVKCDVRLSGFNLTPSLLLLLILPSPSLQVSSSDDDSSDTQDFVTEDNSAMMGGISGMGMMGGFGGMGMGMDMKMSGEDICARHKAMHAMGGRGGAGNTNSKDTWGDVSVGGGKASAKKTPTPAKPKKKKKEKEGNNDNGNDSDGSYEYNDESDIEDDVDAASKPPPAPAPKIHSRDQTLSDMFSPPDKILYDGVFQDARQFAKAQSKWLLVNIQRESDFACHALNRDVWKDGVVESIIADSFVFWQCDVDSTNREVSTLE